MKYNIKDTSLEDKLKNSCNLPPFVAKVLASYDIESIKDVLSYKGEEAVFEQMNHALDIIKKHMLAQDKVVIMGDYDCDGILGTSIMVKAFAKLSYEVGYYIPNRIVDGYGLNVDLVKKFIDKDYKLIITVDNGISAKEAIDYAIEHGISVIITDHHTVDENYLSDVTYIHPHFSNLDYAVSGGFVAYCLACKLIEYEDDYLHALAAITLISDMMPLIKGNRQFVRQALGNIQNKKYLQIASLATGFVDSAMVGTIIAPKVNSLGRLADIYNPNTLVKYFCSNNKMAILNYAKEIEECNNVRKQMTSDYYQEYYDYPVEDRFLMIEESELHEGLIGLLASRFSNEFGCISFVATKNEDECKASLRSVEGVDLYSLISEHGTLFERFGGHKQAMGVSYQASNSQKIKESIIDSLNKLEIKEKEHNVIMISGAEITLDNITSLRYLEPFGNSFSQPTFLLKDALIANIKGLKNNLHHKISILFESLVFEVMIFNNSNLDIKVNDHVDFIVKLGVNEFRGKTSVNMIVEDYLIK